MLTLDLCNEMFFALSSAFGVFSFNCLEVLARHTTGSRFINECCALTTEVLLRRRSRRGSW